MTDRIEYVSGKRVCVTDISVGDSKLTIGKPSVGMSRRFDEASLLSKEGNIDEGKLRDATQEYLREASARSGAALTLDLDDLPAYDLWELFMQARMFAVRKTEYEGSPGKP